MNILYYSPIDFFKINECFELNEISSHHCIVVLRKKINDIIYITNGLGFIAKSIIIESNKKNCLVKVKEINFIEIRKIKHSIAISLLKNKDRLEWLFEKITEMGVYEIYPIICERTEKIGFNKQRFEQILISAMLQSKQSWLPILNPLMSFKDFIIKDFLYSNKLVAYCEEVENKNYFTNFIDKNYNDTLFLIGPEGDFTKQEIDIALKNNFNTISLGKNRLRTETAGLFVCSYFYGNKI